ncbi:LytTR family DNA-binding domain-containing protein [Christensenella tenuis]|jgi:DNA-binding LytR/AlgR family response regulator|uniref:LytTR family transcriptional regulator DNA-binding domain-containing protein n=1 Tax=Christensenella tenuis TaxID=2763033 RepID=A0ABR7EAV3_9FIRM|nr:LytTR family DNA-binding domain-containing protein [Christensenella tenuis]MBC5646891.1 LytTR family transcriptional regulator DNA-binding domain-containing protein [Christensenella tenuis]
MKVTLDIDPGHTQDEIIIRCAELNDDLLKIVALANSSQKKVVGSLGKQTFLLEPGDVYYFECVDDKVFIYTKSKIYDCALRLYEIEEKFQGTNFLRANKSTIINLAKVRSLNPILNGKIEVELENGEKQIISRQYAPALKEKLGLGR